VLAFSFVNTIFVKSFLICKSVKSLDFKVMMCNTATLPLYSIQPTCAAHVISFHM